MLKWRSAARRAAAHIFTFAPSRGILCSAVLETSAVAKKNPAAQPSFGPQNEILPDRGRSMLELLPPCGHMWEKQQVQHYNSFLLLLMCLLTAALVPYLQRII